MKKITVQVKDGTRAELTQNVEVNHLSDLGDSVKEVVDDFVEYNEGVVLPPLSIKAVGAKEAPLHRR